MIAVYDLLALGAAACWASGSLLTVTPVRHLGAFSFTRWRMLLVAAMLWSVVAATGGWHSLSTDTSLGGALTMAGVMSAIVLGRHKEEQHAWESDHGSLRLGVGAARAHHPPNRRILLQTALNGFIGMGLGMTFILMALQKGDVGTVAILSSVSPVLILPR